jgi:stearoyl-CoA desaturase (delta-9 desaturase)
MCFIVPTLVPWFFWGETLWNAYFVCSLLRYVLTLNATWLVNSAAHIWGNRPYDKSINPAENRVHKVSPQKNHGTSVGTIKHITNTQ